MVSADAKLLRDLDDYWIHGRHPEGRLIAAHVWDVLRDECAVWDLETGAAVWRPKARSIAWSPDGAKVGLLVGDYGDDFELRSWPARELISNCAAKPSACCNEFVALSPLGDCAAILWWHQREGGVNLVALEDGSARLDGPGYSTDDTNLLEGPTFSADGSLVAVSEGFDFWWLPDGGTDDPPEEPSPGGRFRRGRLTLVDVATGLLRQFDVEGEVPTGWVPPHDGWEDFAVLGKPRFASADEVVLSPKFGDDCHIRVGS